MNKLVDFIRRLWYNVFMIEMWKDIYGYEGLYQISPYGLVRTLPRIAKNKWGDYTRPRKVLGRILDKHGRYRVSLRKDGKNRKFFIHRLVAKHFIENPDNKKRVKHKNGIRTDNRHINLFWS